ncbi:MAG: FAD-binding oxidoreductase [Rhodobacteraceae bacterium]|nr:FAD-binding oxidoreductase [Paracoccaceae bacterium]
MEHTDNWINFDGKKYRIKEGETALDAMLRGGANLHFSCRKGSCRSCMLEAVSGELGEEAQSRLSGEMRERNLFLPCVTRTATKVEARLPDLSQWNIKALVAEKNQLSDDVWQLLLEPLTEMDWRAGQFINLTSPDGETRSYSLASIREEDYFAELHIRRYPDGKVSNWVAETLMPGDEVEIQGPVGTCYYDSAMAGQPLLLIGVGTGVAPMLGVARDALRRGHSAPIALYHGAALEKNLYLTETLKALEGQYPNFTAHCAASRDGAKQRVVDTAFSEHPDLRKHTLFLAGSPDSLEIARIKAVACGIKLASIHADPFETTAPYMPDDEAKINAIKPDPELWAALNEGELLSQILDDFYTQVYLDPRLSPFFQKVTKSRVSGKQYAFLVGLLTGVRSSFIEPPFNAHHWMVISDELFDYRENLFFECVRAYDLPEHLIARWASLHEIFRRTMVKSAERGQVHNGVEQDKSGYTDEILGMDGMCDGCSKEILEGSPVRMHQRTGEVFCISCEAGAA